MEGLTEGRIVHFVLPDGPNAGEHRPAVVVRVWRLNNADVAQRPPDSGNSNLVVFMDGRNDGDQFAGCIRWETSVVYSAEPKPRTWHWIEKA